MELFSDNFNFFSPELVPFQCSEVPLADEADNSDMTPQCMPVIDPNFVRDSYIDGCILGKLNFNYYLFDQYALLFV